jgi:hypothetical protein
MFDSDSSVVQWLLGDDNPAVKYRTQTELLGQSADKSDVVSWLNAFLPADWKTRKGLWSAYFLNSFAECGLTIEDTGLDEETAIGFDGDSPFDENCGDYMRLRALVRLGLGGDPAVTEIINKLSVRQLPDGGFLCLHRLDKLKYTPKSCVKVNMLALLFCAECKKKGIYTDITSPLLDYFWNHKLFYRANDPKTLILNAREGWRTIDTFYPFEVMRVGLQNIVEAFCALGYGNDKRLDEAWELLKSKETADGKHLINGTLSKSYLPKERAGKPSKWVTFYTLLAEKER